MLKLLRVVALLFCFGLVSGHHFSPRCMPIFGKYPFDDQKFSGDWYVVSKAMRPNKFPGKVTCEKLHYSTETVGNITRTHIEAHLKMDDGSEKTIEGKGQPVFPKLTSSTAMAWKSSDHDKWHGVFGQTIVATDYESYALVHACKELYDEKTELFKKLIFDTIWSRTKTIDGGLLKTLKSLMSSLDIADDKWEDVNNESC